MQNVSPEVGSGLKIRMKSAMATVIGGLLLLLGLTARAGEAGTYHGRTLPEWRAFAKSHSLAALGTPETVSGLMTIVEDPSVPWADRRQFALLLGRIGPSAAASVPMFRRVLQHPDDSPGSSWLWALKALGFLGPPAASALPEVLPLVSDDSQPFFIRSTAMETAALIGKEDARTLAALNHVLASDRNSRDPDAVNELRRAAAEALGLLGPAAAPALPELLRALHSDWPLLQRSAATALGELGPRGELAVPALADLILFGESNDAREAAADALSRIGQPAFSALKQLLADPDLLVRQFAIRGLRNMSAPQQVVPILSPMLDDADPLIRLAAAEAILHHAPNQEAVAVLLDGLKSEQRSGRMLAYRTLSAHLDQLAGLQSELVGMAHDAKLSSQSRQAAARLLQSVQRKQQQP